MINQLICGCRIFRQTHIRLGQTGGRFIASMRSARRMPPEERSFLSFICVYDVYGFGSKLLKMAQGYISSKYPKVRGIPKIGVLPSHPKLDHFSIETRGFWGTPWYPHFRNPPYRIKSPWPVGRWRKVWGLVAMICWVLTFFFSHIPVTAMKTIYTSMQLYIYTYIYYIVNIYHIYIIQILYFI